MEKRTNLTTSLKGKKKARSEDHFSYVTTDKALAELSKGYVLPNTEKNTGWAMQCLSSSKSHAELEEIRLQRFFSHWLAVFVTEVRKTDCEWYPPKYIDQLLCGILRFMRKQDALHLTFWTRKTTAFANWTARVSWCFDNSVKVALEQIPRKLM